MAKVETKLEEYSKGEERGAKKSEMAKVKTKAEECRKREERRR